MFESDIPAAPEEPAEDPRDYVDDEGYTHEFTPFGERIYKKRENA